MIRTINYKNKSISYTIKGSGPSLVFLHGYLEYKEVWSNFVKDFEQDYQVLCIDLPGHGKSESIGAIHTMKEMAQLVKLILDRNGIKQSVLIGHSMGGYISLSFLDFFPNLLVGTILFSSSALNDSSEKKLARNRDIELIRKGKKDMVINNNIPNMFASENLIQFSSQIEQIKTKVKTMSNEGIIAALEGMKERLNYQSLLQSPPVPLLFIAGSLDNLIQIDVSERQIKNSKNTIFKVLEYSGHMGYMEETQTSKNIIFDFLKSINYK
jgi:pimeloyl-ACP methyl ester carboxylesterase